jgi:Rps23 Pro-64 3,4-dihydroxylase Tpa1-like proline 4-hydroxylase
MIIIEQIKKAILTKLPFNYAVIPQCISEDSVNKLLDNMPQNNYYRSLRDTGSDKTYNVVNNLLLKLGEMKFNNESNLNDCWIQLVNALQSKQYINVLSNLLQEDLSECHQEMTLKKYGYLDFISAHTDKADVRATHMIFLNKNWDEKWGGQLCFLRDENNIFKKFIPVIDHSVAFVRADNSWHSVEKIMLPEAERIAIQIAFWNITNRKVLPGRIEETVKLSN